MVKKEFKNHYSNFIKYTQSSHLRSVLESLITSFIKYWHQFKYLHRFKISPSLFILRKVSCLYHFQILRWEGEREPLNQSHHRIYHQKCTKENKIGFWVTELNCTINIVLKGELISLWKVSNLLHWALSLYHYIRIFQGLCCKVTIYHNLAQHSLTLQDFVKMKVS